MVLVFGPILLFAAVAAVIVLLIIVLLVADYQTKKKKVIQHESLEYRYLQRFEVLKAANLEPEERVSAVDSFARDFFAEKFGITSREDYSQLMETFAKNGKAHIIPFCQTMTEIIYSGDPVSAAEVRSIMLGLESLLRREGVLIAAESEEKVKRNLIERFAEGIDRKINQWKKSLFEGAARKQKQKQMQAAITQTQIRQDVQGKQPKAPARIEQFPMPKKMVIVPKDIAKKAMTKKLKEHKYIESIDMLDRIEHKIRVRNSARHQQSAEIKEE